MKAHSVLLISIISMVVLCGLIVIGGVWFPDTFANIIVIKILVTLGVLIALMTLILVLKADLAINKDLKDNNYID